MCIRDRCQGRFADEHFVKGKGGGAQRSTVKVKPLLDDNDLKHKEEAKQKDRGQLDKTAMKVLMSVLYAARMARFDVLRAVGALATKVTKWNSQCDRELHWLMCDINSSLHLRQVGWIGDTHAKTSVRTSMRMPTSLGARKQHGQRQEST